MKNIYHKYASGEAADRAWFASNNDKYRAIESFSWAKWTLSAFLARNRPMKIQEDALPALRGLCDALLPRLSHASTRSFMAYIIDSTYRSTAASAGYPRSLRVNRTRYRTWHIIRRDLAGCRVHLWRRLPSRGALGSYALGTLDEEQNGQE